MPFFKTVTIFFVLFPDNSRLDSWLYLIIKCLPVASLIVFVLLYGMSFSEAYSYSRKILLGLVFSILGDAFLVFKHGYFIHGVGCFAIAQAFYAWAFGFKPFNPYAGTVLSVLGSLIYMFLLPGLDGVMVYVVAAYLLLIATMGWRAIARVQIFDDMWTWTSLVGCAGALCFAVSDLLIAVEKFRYHVPYSHPIIMVTYYAAQLGISLSVVDSQVDGVLRMTQNDLKQKKPGVLDRVGGVIKNGIRNRFPVNRGLAVAMKT